MHFLTGSGFDQKIERFWCVGLKERGSPSTPKTPQAPTVSRAKAEIAPLWSSVVGTHLHNEESGKLGCVLISAPSGHKCLRWRKWALDLSSSYFPLTEWRSSHLSAVTRLRACRAFLKPDNWVLSRQCSHICKSCNYLAGRRIDHPPQQGIKFGQTSMACVLQQWERGSYMRQIAATDKPKKMWRFLSLKRLLE